MIQLHNKIDKIDTILKQYRKIRYGITDKSIPIVINDHVELAAEIGADGVHIGQGDMKPEQARTMIGGVLLHDMTVVHIHSWSPSLS